MPPIAFHSELKEVININSLRELPPVSDTDFFIDFRNNHLENLAGLPYIHFHPGHSLYTHETEYSHDSFRSPRLQIAGNPLRSLHGVPLLGFHHFLRRFQRAVDSSRQQRFQ